MKKILLPVDFSDYSEKAFNSALALSDKNAEIRLLHSHFDPLLETETEMDMPVVDMDATEKVLHRIQIQATEDIEKLAQKFKSKIEKSDKPNVQISTELKRGISEDNIVMVAEEFGADIIAMGTRGMDSTTRTFLGSVTASVIENAEAPVLAIPEDAKESTFGKVMYATDFDKSDIDALSKLSLIFQHKPVQIYCVHFCVDNYKSDLEVLMEDLKQDLQYGKYEGNVNFDLIECDELEKGMDDYIAKHQIDMVAMTTHKRGFFASIFKPSHTKKMLYHTHTPLLAFHA